MYAKSCMDSSMYLYTIVHDLSPKYMYVDQALNQSAINVGQNKSCEIQSTSSKIYDLLKIIGLYADVSGTVYVFCFFFNIFCNFQWIFWNISL
jgi:hypothetical protein